MSIQRWAAPALSLLLFLAACESDPTGPEEQPVRTFQIFASDSVFLDLTPDTIRAVPSSAAAGAWDIGFWRTAPFPKAGEVMIACVCQNGAATGDQVRVMTAVTEQSDFDAVTAAQIPPAADVAWTGTTFTQKPWYRYNITGTDNQIWPTFDVYLIRRGSEVYKLQIMNYYNNAGEPRYITLRYVLLAS